MAAELLTLSNFDSINQNASSQAASAAAANQATLVVQNAAGFAAQSFIVIEAGTEAGELHQISSIAGQTLTLADNLVFAHIPGTRVVQLAGNQLKLYRAPNVDGSIPVTADFLSYPATSPTNPVTIAADQLTTTLTDPNGGSDYWYKYTYFHSVTQAETDLTFSIAVRGGDYGHYVSLDEIRREAGFTRNANVTDEDMADARTSAEGEVNSILAVSGYTLPITTDVPMLRLIAKQLAAGYLLSQAYGPGTEGTSQDGAARKADARATLADIRTHTLILVDSAGVPLAEGDTSAGNTGPNTLDANGDPRPPIFAMADTF